MPETPTPSQEPAMSLPIDHLSDDQCEVLRDLAEPTDGEGDSDEGWARLVYVLPVPLSQEWSNGQTITVPAGTWVREIRGNYVIGYRQY